MAYLPLRKKEPLRQYPLTVVQAPMGYGKTTAVKEFLQDFQAKVLWQTALAFPAIDLGEIMEIAAK